MKIEKNVSAKLIVNTSVLFGISFLLRITSLNSAFVERYYSVSLYPTISTLLRATLNWIPFSIGDVLIIITAIYCSTWIFRIVFSVFKRKITFNNLFYNLIKGVNLFLILYISFSLLWGLNYSRLGITYQMEIVPKVFTTKELVNLTSDLVKKVNRTKSSSNFYSFQRGSLKAIYEVVINDYKNASLQRPYLNYSRPSIKPPLINSVANYLGTAGYYNPFTGEAQVNRCIPHFLLPQIIAHEIAHQLGYAKESEADFVAYLVLKNSAENSFQYSAYLTLFNYANRHLFLRDSSAAKANLEALDSLVKMDETVYKTLFDQHSGLYSTKIYNEFLKANMQSKGMETYGEVITMIIAYQKKYGEL